MLTISGAFFKQDFRHYHLSFLRTNMDEEKEKDKDEETVKPKQEVTKKESKDYSNINDYFDFAFAPEIAEPQKESFEDDIMLKIMRACIFFSRTLKPIISIIFIIIYWGSGLIRSNQIE